MAESGDEVEVAELSEIYDVLTSDAKTIVTDLRGGVAMWREAAAASIAAAGFVLILALSDVRSWSPLGTEAEPLIVALVALAAYMLGLGVFGLRKYLSLSKRYRGLFERAKKLD